MEVRNWQILWKIREEALLIDEFIKGMNYDVFCHDEKSKRAVTQTLLNIGEMERSLTEDFKTKYNHIPWRTIRKTRNVIAHEYGAVNFDVIWQTAIDDIPGLIKMMEDILNNNENGDSGYFDSAANYEALLKAIEDADTNGSNE
jgi:uncharacterized protein with HEPN domain